ncbi:MAG: hypothetical protein V3S64_06320 [bacterium]
MEHREPPGYTTAELEVLAQKGVHIPSPHQVYIARDVPLEAIAPGVALHPFTRLGGAGTRIDAGAVIGAAGAATLNDCWIGKEAVVGALGPVTLNGVAAGPGTVLGCGVAEQAVFLGKEAGDPDFSTGFGFRVRKGSLYEEDANSAQHTDTKMTILFPWVTLGSNINWCDILVAGGSGPEAGRFSEIGSGAIHFNFTPRGDKATGSLLGNVVDGVFLNEERLFIGGHASLVGPLNANFGAITGAGGRFHRNLRQGLNLAAPPSQEAESVSFDLEIYGSIYRIYTHQIEVVGQLCALDAWYGQVRGRLAANDPDQSGLYARGREIVRINVSERIAQLGALAGRMERSLALLRQEGDDDARIGQHRALLEHWPSIEAHLLTAWGRAVEAPAALLSALDDNAAQAGGRYTRAIQALPPAAAEEGREWLRGIVADVASEHILTLIPPLRRNF